nr:potassium channel protein [Pseudanabaena sp. PCC 7367]
MTVKSSIKSELLESQNRSGSMQGSLQRIIIGLSFFVVTIVTAVVGYKLAGWSFLDAIYMVVITIFGVGYGEVRALDSPQLKVFTMLVIVAGTSSAVYTVGGFIQMVTEGEITRALDARRMTKSIESLDNHVIICGFGRIGYILARKLKKSHQSFVVIDTDDDRIELAHAQGFWGICGSASDENVLLAAGIKKARVLATVLPDDATNVFITLTAKELSPSIFIIARGELPSTEKKLKLAGADRVVLPANIGADRMAHMITHPTAIDFLEGEEGRMNLNELLGQMNVQIDELVITPDSPFAGKALSDMEVRGKGAFIVIAIRQQDGLINSNPSHSQLVYPGDTVVVMGHRGDIPKFAQNYAMRREIRYRGAKI